MERIRFKVDILTLFSNAGWLQISSIWLTAHSSIISPYTTAVFLSPIISKTITSVTIICLLVINTIIHYFSTFVTKKLILTANVLNLYQGCQSPLPSAVITPIAPVRTAAITEVNTCFVIQTSPFVIRHVCYQSPLPSAVITPIAPVRAAAITEVNTCFVI